jgi:hypothetical protein
VTYAGGYVGGRPPIGMKAQAGALVTDAREQSAIFRAVELRMPVVRGANTGISGVVDAAGRVAAAIPAFEASRSARRRSAWAICDRSWAGSSASSAPASVIPRLNCVVVGEGE